MKSEGRPRRGDLVYVRARWDAGKQPNGYVSSLVRGEEELLVRYQEGKDWDEFTFNDFEGNKKEINGQTWWFIGAAPTPDEVNERMMKKDSS